MKLNTKELETLLRLAWQMKETAESVPDGAIRCYRTAWKTCWSGSSHRLPGLPGGCGTVVWNGYRSHREWRDFAR